MEHTNWYNVFYFLTVGDNIRNVFSVLSGLTIITFVISLIGLFISTTATSDKLSYYGATEKDNGYLSWKHWKETWGKTFYVSLFSVIFSSIFVIFIPSKKDSLIIIAGGAVGNFISTDSTSKQIPSEAMILLRDKIRSEIKELNINDIVDKDTLKEKTKEELIELLKKQSLNN